MHQVGFFDDYVIEATRALLKQGFTIKWGQDFHRFNRILSQSNERPASASGFNPDFYQCEKLDGIWLAAYRKPGELIHTQACRRVTILPNMDQHLKTAANVYETETFKFDLDNLEINLSPEASRIKGEAIYHGEAWLKGGPDGVRGGSSLFIFSRMMMAKVFSLWRANYIYGLIPPYIGIKGLAQRYGYTRCEQGAVTFLDQTSFPNDLWFVWMTAEEAKSQLRLRPKYFEGLVSPPEKEQISKVA